MLSRPGVLGIQPFMFFKTKNLIDPLIADLNNKEKKMKQLVAKVLSAFAVAAMLTGGTAYAQTATQDAKKHEGHHPEGQAPAKGADQAVESGMMAGMKMGDMHGMMKECMVMHKDGKMCEHQTMEKCQANMKKGECQKMMKQAKAKK